MSTPLPQDKIIAEIVEKVRNRMLEQGLKMPENTQGNILKTLIQDEAQHHISSSTEITATSLAAMIDHTLLKQDATIADIQKVCAEARTHKFATVCVNSSFIPKVAALLQGSGVKPIAVVGFPLGAATTASKAFEAQEAVKNGALEIDMVINIGELKSRDYALVLEDIRAVVEASKPYPVKVILETAMLDHEQKSIACALSKAAGAAFVKTSTGFGPGGATAEDIALMRKLVGPEMGVKASGGIRTYEDAEKMIRAGASRVGASASVSIVQNAGKASKGNKDEATSGGRKPFTGLPYKSGGTQETSAPAKSNKPKPSSSNGNGNKGGGY